MGSPAHEEIDGTELYRQVYNLYIVDRVRRSEIVRLMGGRLTPVTIHTYCRKALEEARDKGLEITLARAEGRSGGFMKLHESKPLSPLHYTIGVRLSRHREFQLKLAPKVFCHRFSFVSYIKLRQIELGIHELSLREMQRIAEIIGITMQELISPLGSVYAAA